VIYEGAWDPSSVGAGLSQIGPDRGVVAMVLFFALAVVVLVIGTAGIALTGIPRLRIPGLAWAISGVWRELHGLRQDQRDIRAGRDLPDLEPLPDSVPPPPATRREPREPKSRSVRRPMPSRP
jgi:hypothetical protein